MERRRETGVGRKEERERSSGGLGIEGSSCGKVPRVHCLFTAKQLLATAWGAASQRVGRLERHGGMEPQLLITRVDDRSLHKFGRFQLNEPTSQRLRHALSICPRLLKICVELCCCAGLRSSALTSCMN